MARSLGSRFHARATCEHDHVSHGYATGGLLPNAFERGEHGSEFRGIVGWPVLKRRKQRKNDTEIDKEKVRRIFLKLKKKTM
jgi:hypothetical protein